MIRKHVGKDGKIRDGAAPWETQSRAMLTTKIQNLRDARRAGARPEGGLKENVDIARRTEIHAMCNPTPAPDAFANGRKIRPRPGMIYARRRQAYADMALAIPDCANYYGGQRTIAIFDVLAVGRGVEDITIWDVVMASAYAGDDLRQYLGPEVFALRSHGIPCDSGTAHTHGTADAWHDKDAFNGACTCTGMILAIVEEG